MGFTDLNSIVHSIGLSPMPMVLSNPLKPDNPLEVVNAAFCSLTGYSEGDIVGRNCRFLAGPDTEPSAQRALREAIETHQPVFTEIFNYRRDGSSFRNGVSVAPICDADGAVRWFLGTQLDLGPAPAEFSERRSTAQTLIANLSPRQQQVLRALSHGLQNKHIAWTLKISPKTVEIHRALLLQRLGVATSGEAIRIAVEAGL
jgi:PAS domain S-box-containing protein